MSLSLTEPVTLNTRTLHSVTNATPFINNHLSRIMATQVCQPPTTLLLWHEMGGGRPWTFGASGCTAPQHGVELGLGHGQAVRIKAAWAAGYWRAGRCLDVMCGVKPHLVMAPCRFRQLREFLQEAVWGLASCDDFYTGD